MNYTTFSQTYGKWEVRAKLPDLQTRGLQETLWLWPDNDIKYGAWPGSGEIDFAEFVDRGDGRDAPDRLLALVLPDAARGDLTGEIAVYRGERGLELVRRDIVDHHCVPGQRADMRDPVAHLACANDSDFSYATGHSMPRFALPAYLACFGKEEGCGAAISRDNATLRRCLTRWTRRGCRAPPSDVSGAR